MLTIQEIRELIEIIDQSSIDEFTYETNGAKVKMKKHEVGNDHVPVVTAVQPVKDTIQQDVVAPKVVEPVSEKVEKTVREEKVAADYDHEIVSPMVGTFYAAPNPESDPYISVGSTVQSESIVCIVEAMKLFNEIEAEVSGEIVEIMVKDGELVEYGQPLFRVKTK